MTKIALVEFNEETGCKTSTYSDVFSLIRVQLGIGLGQIGSNERWERLKKLETIINRAVKSEEYERTVVTKILEGLTTSTPDDI